MKKAIIAFASLAILASCHANYDKTPSGLVYKIFPGSGGIKLSTAKFVKLNIEYTVKRRGKDSVLNSSFGKFPQYNPIDTTARAAYSYMEVLPKCSVGDSVECSLSADTLRKRNINLPLDIFPKGDFIKVKLKILAAFTTREAIMADVDIEQKKAQAREAADISDYVAKHHLTGQKTKNGVFVAINNPGDGMKADSGKVAVVKYKGYLLATGEVFDTNMDSSKGHPQAYPVLVGAHGVIPGWEEALPLFAKGGKGTLVIPSQMGYGAQGNGGIPPNAPLVFDIEVVDVQNAPPQQAPPQRPGAQQPVHK
jgi:FKBP-type peptidyl-prolyl cis-trans isomerase